MSTSIKPLVICFEGIDGGGKSTQINRMREWLEARGRITAYVKDPGETHTGEAIRRILLDKDLPLTAEQQVLLYTAARISGRDVVAKHQAQGFDVLLDRWVMSTYVYQGLVQKIPLHVIGSLHDNFVKLHPDLYIVLDLPAHVATHRILAAGAKEGDPPPSMQRFEAESVQCAENRRKGYRLMAEDDPKAWLIDAEQSPEMIFQDVLEACKLKIAGFDELGQ